MDDVLVLKPSPEVTQRACEARDALLSARATVQDAFFTMCELLNEVKANDYHQVFGYSSFERWLENSDLDLSAREAYYYSSIAHKARKLGLDRADIEPIKVSKLKKIFTLDPKEHENEIHELLVEAVTEKLQAISDKVYEIRHKGRRAKRKAR